MKEWVDAEGRFYSVHSGSHIRPLVSGKPGYEPLVGLQDPQIALLTNSFTKDHKDAYTQIR